MLIDTKQLGQIKPCLYYIQIYDNHFFMNIHRHETLEIMYVSDGTMSLTTLNEKNEEMNYTVFQGQFALIKSNLPHKLSIPESAAILNVEFESSGSAKSIDSLFFENAVASAYPKAQKYCLEHKGLLIFEDSHSVLQSLTRLQEELSNKTPTPPPEQYEFELSYTLLLSQLISDILSSETLLHIKKRGNLFVKKAMDYINANLYRNISLENLCTYVECSKVYLERSFKAEFNSTVSQKINEMRIRRAKSLLKNFTVSSEAVGKAVGFSNQQSFINNFRKATGITPIEYRKRHRLEYKTLHAYEKSYFDKKFDRFFGYSTGTFLLSGERKLTFENPLINTFLIKDNLHDLFGKDKKRFLESRKYLIIDTEAILNEFDFLTFNDSIIQNGFFDSFIGLYVHTRENPNDLMRLVDSIHEFYPFKRILVDLRGNEIEAPEVFDDSHVTDVILKSEGESVQKFLSSKVNIWLERKIQSTDEIRETVTLPIKNFGGIAYSLE